MSQPINPFETLSPTRLFFRCALPNMVSMAVTSLYTIADGIFVGQFLGADALAAINLIMPLILMSFVFADMVAVGSSVQIAIHLGEGKEAQASRIFTVCTGLIVAMSCVIGAAGFFLAGPILRLMGAAPGVTALAVAYMKVYAACAPAIMVFFALDNYLRICGRPRYSMAVNVSTALLNIVLDYLFLGVLGLGIASAALSSCLSLALGTGLSLWPFLRKKLSLQFVRGKVSPALLGNIFYNGSSEFFSNIAGSLLMIVLNSILLRLSGSLAVAAFSIVLYVDSVVSSLLYGVADAMQPAISYSYGAGRRQRLLAFERRVLLAGALICLITLLTMRLGGAEIIRLFVRQADPALVELSLRAMSLFSFTYLTVWIGVGLGSFFTAVNRPGFSLCLALGRALGFPLAALVVLVQVLGIDGVWLTAPVNGVLTAVTALGFLLVFLARERREWQKA